MLDAKVVANLLPKLGVSVDLVRHGKWFWSKIYVWRGKVPAKGLMESSTGLCAVSAPYGQVRVLQKMARTWFIRDIP
jgi:hypothetical protein